MSEPRLYLYRKAGREVWDAEMWLPDRRRRVWRTGITDRAGAEQAARARLETLVASALTLAPCLVDAGGTAPGYTAGLAQTASISTAHSGNAELMASGQEPASPANRPAPAVETKARTARWGERFDRWFFGELASLLG